MPTRPPLYLDYQLPTIVGLVLGLIVVFARHTVLPATDVKLQILTAILVAMLGGGLVAFAQNRVR